MLVLYTCIQPIQPFDISFFLTSASAAAAALRRWRVFFFFFNKVLPAIVSRDEVESILALVDDADLELDSDPDTVDGKLLLTCPPWGTF